MTEQLNQELYDKLAFKSQLKYKIYENTYTTFQQMKSLAKDIIAELKNFMNSKNPKIGIEFGDRGEFEAELKVAGDLLILTMHTNVFEFPRYHEVMKTSYIKDDPARSYCGVINIYNFLSDSFKYSRINDLGYLVARIFINKDLNYMVEGKRQVGMLYNSFITEKIDNNAIKQIIESALIYCIDFDLLTPPYDNVKEVSVAEFQETTTNMRMKTGKRLGFRFQADHDEIR